VISLAFIIAFALVIGMLVFLNQILWPLPIGEATDPRRRLRRVFRVVLTAILLLTLSAGVWGFFIEPNRLIVRQQTIQIDRCPTELSGLRIALIGDIHTGAPFNNDAKLQRIVELTNQQQPDLIVLLGDYMSPNSWHSHQVEPEVTAAGLKNLRAPLGVYAILGNHDWWYNGEKVRREFEQNGFRVLENEVAEVNGREGAFYLAGLADIWTRPQHVNETIAKAPSGSAIIALTHNPDVFPNLPQSVPLLLAAHTHGGQVNLPVWGTPIVPSGFGPKYTAGHVYENGHHLFVTTGIGTSILPVRFRVPPEIVILTINGEQSNR
jgi:predicted MPP superfamily phosphohydrolase